MRDNRSSVLHVSVRNKPKQENYLRLHQESWRHSTRLHNNNSINSPPQHPYDINMKNNYDDSLSMDAVLSAFTTEAVNDAKQFVGSKRKNYIEEVEEKRRKIKQSKLVEKAIDIELALRRSIEEEEEEEEEEEFTWQEEQPAKGSGYQEPAEGNDDAGGNNNNFMTAPGFQLSDGAVGRNNYDHDSFTPLSSDDDNTELIHGLAAQ